MTSLEHLRDHIELYRAVLQSRARAADPGPVQRVVAYQERIVVRELEHPGLDALVAFERLGLRGSERHVLWFLAAMASCPQVRALVASITKSIDVDPTLIEIRQIVHGVLPSMEGLDDLAAGSTLRKLMLIERTDGRGDTHESRQTWAISSRMLAILHGEHRFDAGLAEIIRPALPVAPGRLICAEAIRESVRRSMQDANLVVLTGTQGSGRRSLLIATAQADGHEVLELDASVLAKDPQSEQHLRSFARECRLLACTPLIKDIDSLEDAHLASLDRELLRQIDGPVLATCGARRLSARWGRPAIYLSMPSPSSQELAAIWMRELPGCTPEDGNVLASRYPLAPALIHHAAKVATARAAGDELTGGHIVAGVRSVLDDRVGHFARRVTVTQTWNDIVLPSDSLEAVAELISRVRGRGRVLEEWGFGAKVGKGLGVTALFSGPPGTGKTMLASLIAQDLGLELYQVDLGKVVSKWIGETEKNLGALFDAAEAGHAILLFDEADALFGKRTDVRSSNDRHANLETNYLLQRLESYTGICLLTTNHDSHIDPAFQRRLSLHLRIELPDISERAELWRTMLPPAAPVANDIDFERLAQRYAMSGGYIRNAVLRAAFVAADHDRAITHDGLERAARREYEGMGKIVAG